MTDRPLWPSPEPIWQASPDAVAAGEAPTLSGPWRLLLLGDGSPTRHLQSLTGVAVEVEVISMAADPDPGSEAPDEVSELERPLLRRQVPYWSRHYRFFRGGRELTVIREVFSPRLQSWLGPAEHITS